MIKEGVKTCPSCNGTLKRYDQVQRIVKSEYGKIEYIKIRRYKCVKCGVLHRELPEYLKPHKQFTTNIIDGVINGSVTPYDLKYEDYPCEVTMNRLKKEFNQKL